MVCFALQSSSEPQQTKAASENITRKALRTVNTLASALLVTKVAGEEETKIETESLAVGISRENARDIASKPIGMAGSEFVIPNVSAFRNFNSSLDRVVIYLNLILFNLLLSSPLK